MASVTYQPFGSSSQQEHPAHDATRKQTKRQKTTPVIDLTTGEMLISEACNTLPSDTYANRMKETARLCSEEAAMQKTTTGKAWKFVEQIRQILFVNEPTFEFATVCMDDMLYMAERMLDMQDIFCIEGKPVAVDIGYHYTRNANLERIRTTGLLTYKERQASNIESKFNGAAYGDGVYTGNNPFDFNMYGDVGLLVARLQGSSEEGKRPYRRPSTADLPSDTTGDTVLVKGTREMRVLKHSYQCIPLVRYATKISFSDSGRGYLFQYHCKLQAIVDNFFNEGRKTEVQPYNASSLWRVHNSAQRTNYAHRARVALSLKAPLTTVPKHRVSAVDNSQGIFDLSNPTVNTGLVPSPVSSKRKEELLCVALCSYLERTDQALAKAASGVVKKCFDKYRQKERGFESLETSCRLHLAGVGVLNSHWDQAESYLAASLNRKSRTPQANRMQSGTQIANIQDPKYDWLSPLSLTRSPNPKPAPVVEKPVGNRRVATIQYTAPEVLSSSDPCSLLKQAKPSEVVKRDCSICLSCLSSSNPNMMPVALKVCGHQFHHRCILQALGHGVNCPLCRAPVSEPQGKMPSGTMQVYESHNKSCAGFPPGVYMIRYLLPAGVQKSYHPVPGLAFGRCHRIAYLPSSSPDGRALLKRLVYAFSHGLTFTIGRSLSTGRDNAITWSSIHHKTVLSGGAHGFPDASFFGNCNGELDSLGVPSAEHCPEIPAAPHD